MECYIIVKRNKLDVNICKHGEPSKNKLISYRMIRRKTALMFVEKENDKNTAGKYT